ncbi:G-protein coupled receptor 39 isoform X2 [Mustela lutreola]|uniref:G-protein coupled receptor 39 isoform X2 n=1 Tax=Mustela lutreola TaxID=9666 RepID=UPI002796EBB8|nr:G-protein coupled receptor 39 isoform X2 [Mustela lutreola]
MASPQGPSSECSHVIDHTHVPEFEVATWIKITLVLVYLAIFVVGIVGNSVTIRVTQVLQKKGYLQKEVTDHMVSLACSDILVFLIGMPMEFYSIIWNPLTTPSYALSCKIHTFLFEACSYATLLHVLTLSFERYVAICHPFSRWTVFQSSIFSAFIIYLLVLVSVAFMCWNMMQVLMRSGQAGGTRKGQQPQLKKSESEESRTARRQTIIFLRLIVVTLAVCWMPNQVRRIMAAAKPKHDWTKTYFRAYMILLPFSDTFFYLSSIINPLLYNVSSQQFRRVFGQVLRCHLTLPHANHSKHLRAHGACTAASTRSARRPLIFRASWSNSSARTNKVFLSTFQSEAKPQSEPQQLSLESLEPNSATKPPTPATGNGLQEHEV